MIPLYDLDTYQLEVEKYSRHTVIGGDELPYPVLGLLRETGELANKVKKIYRDRDGMLTSDDRPSMVTELGDCLWYLAEICTVLGLDLSQVAAANLAKLEGRRQRGTIGGSGDEQ